MTHFDHNDSRKTSFFKDCQKILKNLSGSSYALVESYDTLVGILRNDGAFAGSYTLQSLTHIDDIAASNIDDDDFPSELNGYRITPDFWSQNLSDDFDDFSPSLDLRDDDFSFRFGDQHQNIITKLQNQEMTFDEVFDLLVGSKRTARVFDKQGVNADKAFSLSSATPVVLQLDVDFDVVVERNGKLVWSTERVGSVGDTVLCCNNYVTVETPTSFRSFRLYDEEFSAAPVSLKDRLEDKRQTSAPSSSAPTP